MRELLSWRLLAALAALAGLAFLVKSTFADDDELQAVIAPEPIPRKIDLIAPVSAALPSDDFSIGEDGLTTGFVDLVLPDDRTMRIAPGTPGESTCLNYVDPNQCGVLADVLGDAVVWFALVPQAPRQTAELPPIVDLDEGYAVFENGWHIAYPAVIERECGDVDIPSFGDFLRRFGPDSVTVVDLNKQEVTAVRCGDQVAPDTVPPNSGTPDTGPATSVPNPAALPTTVLPP